MAKINLLPWREEYRQEKKQEFLTQLGLVAGVALLSAYIWVQVVDGRIDNQSARNGMLQSEITLLNKQVEEISELKKKRTELIARMKVIQDLQGTRPTIVHYFDEMVRATPDGIFFSSIKRQGNVISIEGITESNNRVSAFMRNLDQSEWFASPNLKSIKANSDYGDQAMEFSLQLQAVLPAGQRAEEDA